MKKISNYFLGFAAIALMAACSNDEIAPEVDNTTLPGVANGEAYLNVRLQDASAMTRATDGGYENGIASEHTVKDAQFFFFDAQGVFVGKASVWNGGNDNGDHGSTGNNVEFKGNTVIVLRGVTEKNFPEYLLTVINAEGFTAQPTIEATSQSLKQWYNTYTETVEGKDPSTVDCFVMSTSSYFGTDETKHNNNFYYATKILSTQFKPEPIAAAESGAVQVYVERLAAKVQVETGEKLTSVGTDKDGKKLYKLNNVTIAGNENGQVAPNEGVTEVYVKFSNWGLSATTKDSYLSKQLKDSWKETAPFANWDNSGDYRCFWAQSTVYDKTIVTEGENKTLNYTTFGNLKNTVDGNKDNNGYAYCNENTNIVDRITENGKIDPAKATSVLLGAMLCDKDGNELDLIRHNGLLFKKDDYKKYVINAINKSKPINIYVADSENEGKYIQATELPSWLDLKRVTEGDNKGMIKVVANEKATISGTYYHIEEGVSTAYTDAAAVIKALQDALDGYSSDETLLLSDEAFTKGKMYYNIPIEHLAGFGTEGENTKVIIEGSYGVVRNHWYRITLNKIENIGTGVFDPNEEIIPEIPEQKYYLDATINILSWKIVNQSVEL